MCHLMFGELSLVLCIWSEKDTSDRAVITTWLWWSAEVPQFLYHRILSWHVGADGFLVSVMAGLFARSLPKLFKRWADFTQIPLRLKRIWTKWCGVCMLCGWFGWVFVGWCAGSLTMVSASGVTLDTHTIGYLVTNNRKQIYTISYKEWKFNHKS